MTAKPITDPDLCDALDALAIYIRKLEDQRQELFDALKAVTGNIDVSTIRPGKRNDKRWGDLAEMARDVIKRVREDVEKPPAVVPKPQLDDAQQRADATMSRLGYGEEYR